MSGWAGLLIGPHPLRRRWGIAMAAAVIGWAAFVLHLILFGTARSGPLVQVFHVGSFVALYMLVFRLIHPALVRRMTRNSALNTTIGIPRRFVEWYLSTPQR